jgi:hypothetical protein
MRNFALLLAASGCLLSAPAIAGTPAVADQPIVVAEEFCVGPACVGVRDRDREEWRYRHHREEGCREVTVRERHGDEVVIRKHRTCD